MDTVNSFFKDEEAMETIEFLVVLAVIAGLAAIVMSVGKTIKTRGTEMANNLDNYAKS